MPRGRSKGQKGTGETAAPATENHDVFEHFSEEEDAVAGNEDTNMHEDINGDAKSSDTTSDDSSSEADEEEDESGAGQEPSKNETELELEKLVFGDAAGFREAVSGFSKDDGLQDEDFSDSRITNVADADLFLLDATPGTVPTSLEFQLHKDDDEDEREAHAPAAWEDSDDERMSISLMAVPRLRKLRNFEGEDVISGQEYARRLRRQYEMLHPRPAWASWRPEHRPAKRRRLSDDASDSEAEADGMDVDDADSDISPQQPLAKLLRSSAPLTRSSDTTSRTTGVPQLTPETIAIQRLADIGPVQPHAVTSLSIHPTLPLLLTAGLSSTMYLHHLRLSPPPPTPPNPLLTTLSLAHTPLTTAAFSPHSTSPTDPKIYLSSPRRYYHTWTLPTGAITKTTRIYGEQTTSQRKITTLKPSPCGRWLGLLGTSRKGVGTVNVLSAVTSQWVGQARTEARGGLADFAWWGDGEGLSMLSKGGEVTEWSVGEKKVMWRWIDEGAVNATVIALGADPSGKKAKAKTTATKQITARRQKRYSASDNDDTDIDIDPAQQQSPPHLGPDIHTIVGTASGIVTIYSRASFPSLALSSTNITNTTSNTTSANPRAQTQSSLNPTPLRTLTQLTTPISHLSLSPDGQLLLIASRWKKDALRLVHLPTCSVYRNWPTAKTPIGRVSGAAVGIVDAEDGGEGGGKRMVVVVGNEAGAVRCWVMGGA